MARTFFAVGAIGPIVKRIQKELGVKDADADGIYGSGTATVVSGFQRSHSLPAMGAVDDATWNLLMKRPVPAASERALQLTAAFEGHGFELAVGNFDGALLTWGIIGFTMASGEVQAIVLNINTASPQLVQQAFGTYESELLDLMRGPHDKQLQWTNDHTLDHGGLAEPWKTMFARFGSFPEVQAEQMAHVRNEYMEPAVATAKSLGLITELGLALCFDIHVQNGGIKTAAMADIQQQITPGMAELDLRRIVANAVASHARPIYREDVRRRKLTIATGQGTVHGHNYVLTNWGLGEFNAAELLSAQASG